MLDRCHARLACALLFPVSFMTRPSWPWALPTLVIALSACGASAQRPVLDTAWENATIRHDSFEATLRVLDDHPEYVHEFLDLAVKHQAALDAFLDDTAKRLEDDALARDTAKHLAAYPKGLKQILIATLDRISNEPAGENAAAQAMAARPQLAAIVITQRDDALKPTLHALILEVMKNERARRAFMQGMADNSQNLAQLIADDPAVLSAFVKALGRVGLHKGKAELEALAKALL